MAERIDPIPKEARTFQGRRAGLVTRAAAGAIDIGVVAVILGVAYLGLCAVVFIIRPSSFSFPSVPWWLAVAAGYVILTVYFAATWSSGGRSYGCHVMGLRVVGRHGALLGPATALLRAAFCVAFPLGLLWVAVSRSNRSVQDVVLRTSVVYDWDVRPRAHPHAAMSTLGEDDATERRPS